MVWVRFHLKAGDGSRHPSQWALLPKAVGFTLVKGGAIFTEADGKIINHFKTEELYEISDHADLMTKVQVKVKNSAGDVEYSKWSRQDAFDALGRRIP